MAKLQGESLATPRALPATPLQDFSTRTYTKQARTPASNLRTSNPERRTVNGERRTLQSLCIKCLDDSGLAVHFDPNLFIPDLRMCEKSIVNNYQNSLRFYCRGIFSRCAVADERDCQSRKTLLLSL